MMPRLLILATVCLLVCTFFACSTPRRFDALYDHYFPKGSDHLEGDYRRMYDDYLFGPRPKSARQAALDVYDAFHDDAAAAHRFFGSSERGEAGEYGEAWYSDCLLLLIRLGDTQFSKLLAREALEIRESVGVGIETRLDPRFQNFPMTRSLYKYRFSRGLRPRPNQAMQPTAGRRTPKFPMTPTSFPAATRALASGG